MASYRRYLLFLAFSVCAVFGVGAAAVIESPLRQDGYRGIWFTLGQFSKYGDKYSGGLGTYTANHTPLAVYSPKARKTFFTYGGTREGKRHLLIMVSSYDHRTGEVPRPVVVHDKQGVNDPHDNASLNLDDQGYVWVFVSGRGRARPGFKYRSRAPLSIEAFERVSEEEMTYPQPWLIPGQGWLHLFTKYTKGRELYWETSSDGRTWSADQKLAGFGGHYQVSGARGRKVGTFFNYHPGGNVDRRTNLYYAQTEDGGRTWTTVSGERLALPLSDKQNPALVIDFESQSLLMYTCDLNWDAKGNPALFYVVSPQAEPGPLPMSTADVSGPRSPATREFRVTAWDGTKWWTSTVARTDHNYDMGSLWSDGRVWKVMAPTAAGPQPFGTGGEVCLWSSRDGGRTWSQDREVTSGSERNHSYMRRVVNGRDPFFAFWADGDSRSFSESHLYFCNRSGRVWKLPYDLPERTEQPKLLKR